MQAAEPLGLRFDEIAPAADQQPDLEVDLGGGLDGPRSVRVRT